MLLTKSQSKSDNQYLTAELAHILDERTFNTTRFSYNGSNSRSANPEIRAIDPALSFLPGAPLGQISVTGFFSMGPRDSDLLSQT